MDCVVQNFSLSYEIYNKSQFSVHGVWMVSLSTDELKCCILFSCSEWDQPPDEMRPPGSIPIKVCIAFLS